jgi:alpha-amylase
MGVLLQAFYQRGDKGVPSPEDGDQIDVWWDHLAKQANELSRAGFTAVWLPPVTKGKCGKDAVGYSVFDDYDLGSKNQKRHHSNPLRNARAISALCGRHACEWHRRVP